MDVCRCLGAVQKSGAQILCLWLGLALLVACGGGGGASAGTTITGTSTVSFASYNLYAPLNATETYLIDDGGSVVHSWSSSYRPGLAVYLLEGGELLHTGNVGNSYFTVGGAGGVVEIFDWDSNLTWQYSYSDSSHLQHHDVETLPNGNLLLIAWEYKSQSEALASGRDPNWLSDAELWPDSIIEVEPSGANSGTIIWEWHAWDHLVQDYDAARANYGVVADHPERIDLNYGSSGGADWTHINAVDYNAELDQILLSVHNFSEIWIIDHSITSAEAAGHTGGSSGRGGDLLYRWGNPQAYGAGSAADQQLFAQHDAEWIGSDLAGAGDILIFNNGAGRSGGNYSSVDEIVPPLNGDGSYAQSGNTYRPDAPLWIYVASIPSDFFAMNISGSQRLSSGNTLICNGPDGYFFEVTEAGETVWEYYAGGAVFRVERYTADDPVFSGTSLANVTTQ